MLGCIVQDLIIFHQFSSVIQHGSTFTTRAKSKSVKEQKRASPCSKEAGPHMKPVHCYQTLDSEREDRDESEKIPLSVKQPGKSQAASQHLSPQHDES